MKSSREQERAPERTICYQCMAVYRGVESNPAHEPYDLGIAGRFADDYDDQQKQNKG